MLADSHCHLDRINLAPFGGGLAGVLDAAAANGVTRLLSVAVDLENWPALARMTEPYPHIALSVGVHPSEDGGRAPTVKELVALGRASRVVAIGETGLDYYYGADSASRQQDWFRIHIAAARELGKPLIVHNRDARADTLRILEEEGAPEVGGVLHCFTEDWAVASAVLDRGFLVSFSGILTFPKAGALREVAARVPLDRLLVETDAPYLAPHPWRGATNAPFLVPVTVRRMADVLAVDVPTLCAAIAENSERLYGPW